MPIPYVYKIPEDKTLKGRKIVVVDGQPYYESTGRNSGKPNVWFPFIMLRGRVSVHEIHSSLFSSKLSKKINEKENKHYLVKVLRHYFKETVVTLPVDKEDKITLKRNSFKNHLITAARLTGPTFPEQTLIKACLTIDEIKLAREPILLEDKPRFSTHHPHIVNRWLIENGAQTISELLENKKVETKIETTATEKKESKEQSSLTETESQFSALHKLQKRRFKPY